MPISLILGKASVALNRFALLAKAVRASRDAFKRRRPSQK
jgi:hypothetical protein